MPTLVYLYGPPASGKLTVATALAESSGYRLFHNHLTVNPLREVFEFGSPAFIRVSTRWRLDVFAEAMASRIDLIFTNNSAWGGENGREQFVEFAEQARQVVAANGGRTLFVQLTAPRDVMLSRVSNQSRVGVGKVIRPERLIEKLDTFDPSALHDNDILIDTSTVTPEGAAAQILAAL